MSYLENYKDLSSQILEARFVTPETTLTAPIYRVRNFDFKKKMKFCVFFKSQKRHISQNTQIRALIVGGKIWNPCEYFSSLQLKG